MKRIALAVMLFCGLGGVPAQAAPKLHVGKALKTSAKVVSAPVRKPKSAVKALTAGTITGILTPIEGFGVTLEAVGMGVQKVGGWMYSIGGVLAGK